MAGSMWYRGNIIRVRFYFATRALTDSEKATFTGGGDLPAGVGVDPDTVKFDYKAPGAVLVTRTYPTAITKEKIGQYYTDIDTSTPLVDGKWFWRGYSTGTGQGDWDDSFYVEALF